MDYDRLTEPSIILEIFQAPLSDEASLSHVCAARQSCWHVGPGSHLDLGRFGVLLMLCSAGARCLRESPAQAPWNDA